MRLTILSLMLAILAMLVAPLGCGQLKPDECKSASDGATITINPSSFTVTDPHDVWRTVPFTITVKDADSNPLNSTRIVIFHAYAVPDWHGFVQLYNGSTPVNSPFEACTDDFGVYNLRLDYDAGTAFTGDLEVRSGTAFAIASLSVNQ
jgi:hypothetical protein